MRAIRRDARHTNISSYTSRRDFAHRQPHCSMPFGEGPLPRRSAFVLRFVEATSHYDLNRAHLLEFPVRTYPSYKPVVRHHIEIAEEGGKAGDLLVDCEYFDNPDRRLLRRA